MPPAVRRPFGGGSQGIDGVRRGRPPALTASATRRSGSCGWWPAAPLVDVGRLKSSVGAVGGGRKPVNRSRNHIGAIKPAASGDVMAAADG